MKSGNNYKKYEMFRFEISIGDNVVKKEDTTIYMVESVLPNGNVMIRKNNAENRDLIEVTLQELEFLVTAFILIFCSLSCLVFLVSI